MAGVVASSRPALGATRASRANPPNGDGRANRLQPGVPSIPAASAVMSEGEDVGTSPMPGTNTLAGPMLLGPLPATSAAPLPATACGEVSSVRAVRFRPPLL